MGKRRGCSYCEGKEIKGLLKGREEGRRLGCSKEEAKCDKFENESL